MGRHQFSRRKQILVLKLATYGQREKAFLLSSKFCPNGLSALAQGYIYMVKHEKNVYKIIFQSNFFKPATNGQSDKGFLLTSKVCLQGVVCPCPRAIYIYKFIKNVYKIRFLLLNLQRMGKVMRAFCLHQHLFPRGCLPLPWGYVHV